MTAHHEYPNEMRRLLERILDRVDAIDDNVETMLERFDEYIDNLRYGHGWYDDRNHTE